VDSEAPEVDFLGLAVDFRGPAMDLQAGAVGSRGPAVDSREPAVGSGPCQPARASPGSTPELQEPTSAGRKSIRGLRQPTFASPQPAAARQRSTRASSQSTPERQQPASEGRQPTSEPRRSTRSLTIANWKAAAEPKAAAVCLFFWRERRAQSGWLPDDGLVAVRARRCAKEVPGDSSQPGANLPYRAHEANHSTQTFIRHPAVAEVTWSKSVISDTPMTAKPL